MLRRLVLFFAAAAAALALEGRSIADYQIQARFLAHRHAVEASEILTWHNNSPDTISELQFHLYMSAFRDGNSSFAREDERAYLREGSGSISVKRLAIAGGADLTKTIRFIHPDDDNAGDRTVVSVPLPHAVPPGGSIRVAIDFVTRLPRSAARAGYHGDYHMFTQWFPKIGVWEAAGQRHSAHGHWNCHQYHATTEFYSDYGHYDVEITAPSDFVVGATGVAQSQVRDEKAHTTTYRFLQADIHDFAWTAQRGFVRVVRRFDPERAVSSAELSSTAKLLGLPESDVRLTPVDMIVLVQPEHRSQIDTYFRALENGLKYFGLWYGAYPYPTLTMVDPPYGADETGGMEYPTFITTGTNWVVARGDWDPAFVTVHEFGHQFWYGLVGSNEFEESWLDEGFNTYSTGKILDLAYAPFNYPVRYLNLPLGPFLGTPLVTQDSYTRGDYLLAPDADSMVRNGWEYAGRKSYRINSYQRPAVVLRTLENYLGAGTMARILRTYQQRWRYRHPDSLDFLAVVNEVSGRDMKWFFDQFVFGSGILDYAVDSVHRSTVQIRRNGEAIFPVEVRVRFRDGTQAWRTWDGRYRWTQFHFPNRAIESVEVDPAHKILLDANFTNNSYTRPLQAAPLMKWTENLLFWAGNLLLAVAGIA
ncbi:MAG TPA: M1 family metallopeptidase [Bryobacteraceae bacterium]